MGLNYMQDSQQTPVLSAVGVGKDVADSTGTLSILSDVDLTVYAGETLAIVGASGSGKSTLLSILVGLDTPSHGLSERLRHYPKVMSGGEQQRVALARAFVMRPKLLVADEPTGSLDFATGEAVMNLMFELNQDQGTTLLMVTHDRAIAARCQQRIGLQAGKVVERS
jgi:predicted ABC-type transport system involved in lysophospholipase L1 biosynthesis ATPase subunit